MMISTKTLWVAVIWDDTDWSNVLVFTDREEAQIKADSLNAQRLASCEQLYKVMDLFSALEQIREEAYDRGYDRADGRW